MSEHTEAQTRINVSVVSFDLLLRIVRFLYGGELQVQSLEVLQVLEFAGKYQVVPLKEICSTALFKHIEPCIGVTMWVVAKMYHVDSLVDNCRTFCQENFMVNEDVPIANSLGFLCADKDLIIELLAYFCLQVPSENDVFAAIVDWLMYSQEERIGQAKEIFKKVLRRECLDADYVTAKINSEKERMSVEMKLMMLDFITSLYSMHVSDFRRPRMNVHKMEQAVCLLQLLYFGKNVYLKMPLVRKTVRNSTHFEKGDILKIRDDDRLNTSRVYVVKHDVVLWHADGEAWRMLCPNSGLWEKTSIPVAGQIILEIDDICKDTLLVVSGHKNTITMDLLWTSSRFKSVKQNTFQEADITVADFANSVIHLQVLFTFLGRSNMVYMFDAKAVEFKTSADVDLSSDKTIYKVIKRVNICILIGQTSCYAVDLSKLLFESEKQSAESGRIKVGTAESKLAVVRPETPAKHETETYQKVYKFNAPITDETDKPLRSAFMFGRSLFIVTPDQRENCLIFHSCDLNAALEARNSGVAVKWRKEGK